MLLSFITHISKAPLVLKLGRHFVPPWREEPVFLIVCLFPSVCSQTARSSWLTSEPSCLGNVLWHSKQSWILQNSSSATGPMASSRGNALSCKRNLWHWLNIALIPSVKDPKVQPCLEVPGSWWHYTKGRLMRILTLNDTALSASRRMHNWSTLEPPLSEATANQCLAESCYSRLLSFITRWCFQNVSLI